MTWMLCGSTSVLSKNILQQILEYELRLSITNYFGLCSIQQQNYLLLRHFYEQDKKSSLTGFLLEGKKTILPQIGPFLRLSVSQNARNHFWGSPSTGFPTKNRGTQVRKINTKVMAWVPIDSQEAAALLGDYFTSIYWFEEFTSKLHIPMIILTSR